MDVGRPKEGKEIFPYDTGQARDLAGIENANFGKDRTCESERSAKAARNIIGTPTQAPALGSMKQPPLTMFLLERLG